MPNGDKLLPFVRLFYGSPSTFLWEDELGTVNFVPQGEGGEQGDPLMPLLFSLGPRFVCTGRRGCVPANMTMCTSQAVLSGQWTVTSFWKKCGGTPRSDSTSGKQWSGSGLAPEGVEALEEGQSRSPNRSSKILSTSCRHSVGTLRHGQT